MPGTRLIYVADREAEPAAAQFADRFVFAVEVVQG